jgi:hypothetical protein
MANPLSSAVVVVTAAVKKIVGGWRLAADALAAIASFGSGGARIVVKVVFPRGAAAPGKEITDRVTVIDPDGARQIARHRRGQRGRPQIRDEHYPAGHAGRRALPGDRTPKAANPAEAAFLAIGDGAKTWLVEAAAAGATRVRSKMAEAVAFAKLHGAAAVDQALGTAALAGRFAEADLAAILAHQQGGSTGPPARASETHSLQPGTASWAGFGATTTGGQ